MTLEKATESFAKGMKEAAEQISILKPDFVIVPMMGAVPLIDGIYAADDSFDINGTFYMPASSHIRDINAVMRNWLTNFLDANLFPNKPVTIVTIDEVVSGNSVIRVHKAVREAIDRKRREFVGKTLSEFWNIDNYMFQQAALNLNNLTEHKYNPFLGELVLKKKMGRYRENREELQLDQRKLKQIIETYFSELVTHRGIGIEDSKDGKYQMGKAKRNPSYQELVESRRIIPIGVEAILTMDKPGFCPLKYETLEGKTEECIEHVRFKPTIQKKAFVTEEYLELLRRIAQITGNQREIKSVCLERAMFSADYLDKKFGGNFEEKEIL